MNDNKYALSIISLLIKELEPLDDGSCDPIKLLIRGMFENNSSLFNEELFCKLKTASDCNHLLATGLLSIGKSYDLAFYGLDVIHIKEPFAWYFRAAEKFLEDYTSLSDPSSKKAIDLIDIVIKAGAMSTVETEEQDRALYEEAINLDGRAKEQMLHIVALKLLYKIYSLTLKKYLVIDSSTLVYEDSLRKPHFSDDLELVIKVYYEIIGGIKNLGYDTKMAVESAISYKNLNPNIIDRFNPLFDLVAKLKHIFDMAGYDALLEYGSCYYVPLLVMRFTSEKRKILLSKPPGSNNGLTDNRLRVHRFSVAAMSVANNSLVVGGETKDLSTWLRAENGSIIYSEEEEILIATDNNSSDFDREFSRALRVISNDFHSYLLEKTVDLQGSLTKV